MHLLTITDDAALRDVLRATLGEAGCEFHPSSITLAALDESLQHRPDALLYDLAGRGDGGPLFIRTFGQRPDRIPLLVLCVGTDREAGLRAVKEGAADYLLRPLSMEELATRLRRIQELEHLKREAGSLRTALERTAARGALVVESQPMIRLRDSLASLGLGRDPILLLGERGTGKKTLAEFVHRIDGQRKPPATILSCRGSSEPLFESPAWKEAQESGTLILDAVELLSPGQQQALADFLAQRKGDANDGARRPVRIVALSAARLDDRDERGGFSSALWGEFERAVFLVPPLRERPSDIPALLAHFAQRTAQKLGRPVSVSPHALAMLAIYPWPGNVYELESAVERAALLGGSGRLEYADFGLVPGLTTPGDSPQGALELKPQVEAFERQVILQGLHAAKGNRQSAARLLGISLRTLFYKIKRYRIES
jgi:DNA-binding NtrC family response regulator